MYAKWFCKMEMRSAQYLMVAIRLFSWVLDWAQIRRYNVQIGIPDFPLLFMATSLLAPLGISLTGLPTLVMF